MPTPAVELAFDHPPPPVTRTIVSTLQEPMKSLGRIDSIDLLRGIVMVIMMLDHTREFVHYPFRDPLDLTQTHLLLFLTRWITHFCAPVFVFLAGTGAYLQLARGKTKRELSRFLVTRGLWLIVLEVTVIRLLIFFNASPRFLGLLQVIWVIGLSMVILAALVHLPLKVITAFGLLMIFLHNLLDRYPAMRGGPNGPAPGVGTRLWMVLHQPGFFPVAGSHSPVVFLLYPLIPWAGVMAVGYAFGAVYQQDPALRRRLLRMIGGFTTVLFILIRAINVYGDPQPWSVQKSLVFTLLSFVNTQKYPPSLLYLLMTLGPAILALAWFESRSEARRQALEASRTGRSLTTWVRDFFITFGRVPLFFYLLQWLTAHGIAILLYLAFGQPVTWLFQSILDWNPATLRGLGFNLVVVYAAWVTGVLLLYPLCKWFAGFRQRRRDWWLSYL